MWNQSLWLPRVHPMEAESWKKGPANLFLWLMKNLVSIGKFNLKQPAPINTFTEQSILILESQLLGHVLFYFKQSKNP